MKHLLHAELVQCIPIVGEKAATALNERAAEAMADARPDPNITVAIRSYNEAPKLELLLQDVSSQVMGSEVEVIVVDNESTDHTRDVVREYGAELVTLPRGEFTYPRSMNLCMQAASHDAVFLTVAHAQLSTSQTLHAGARNFQPDSDVSGVFSVILPTQNASRSDKWMDALFALELFGQPRRIKKAGMGVMAATGAMFSKAVWKELDCFDESYQTGGEDTALARAMLARGHGIVKEPALAVHHSHGLGAIETVKEIAHIAKTVRGPRALRGDVKTRRQARFDDAAK